MDWSIENTHTRIIIIMTWTWTRPGPVSSGPTVLYILISVVADPVRWLVFFSFDRCVTQHEAIGDTLCICLSHHVPPPQRPTMAPTRASITISSNLCFKNQDPLPFTQKITKLEPTTHTKSSNGSAYPGRSGVEAQAEPFFPFPDHRSAGGQLSGLELMLQ